MTDCNKKKEERVFNEFCQIMQWDYNCFFSSECPDFVSQDEKIGIELTEYHSDNELEYDEERKRVKTVSRSHKYESIKYDALKKAEKIFPITQIFQPK